MKYGKMVWMALVITGTACASGDIDSRMGTGQSLKVLTCKNYDDDSCCDDDLDGCKNTYGKSFATYMGFEAKSNGFCTNWGYGMYQCVTFVRDFYSDRLRFDLGSLGDAGMFMTGVENKDYLDKEIFAFRSSVQVVPRETDILVFSHRYYGCIKKESGKCVQNDWINDFGHVVLVSGIDSAMSIRIIEQNVIPTTCDQDSSVSYGRKLKVNPDINYVYAFNTVETPTSKWEYLGIIRHNLAGIYPDIGWHKDGMSQLFRDAYLKIANGDDGKSLGWAFSDNGGSPFVHRIRNLELQNFKNTNPDNRFGTDGETALVVSPSIGLAGPKAVYLLKEGFWGAYKCIPGSDGKPMGGAEYLGAPSSDEVQRGKIDGNCQTLPDSDSSPEVTYQLFEGGCMWWKNEVDAKVHVHLYSGALIDAEKASACGVNVENNPPSANCKDDCVPGTQQCFGSSQIKICGHPGPDSCYHWLTLNCGEGTSCVNNACVTSTGSTVTIAVIGSGGMSSTGGASTTGGLAPTGTQNCTWHSRRCTSNPSIYQICIKDEYSGSTDWMSFDCAVGMSCTDQAGICSASTLTGTGGSSAVTVSIATISTGGMSATGGALSSSNSSGGSSVGGSSSLGGTMMMAIGGTSAGNGSTGGIASSVSSGGSSVVTSVSGGTSGSLSSKNDELTFRYEGPVIGAHELSVYWQNPDGTTRAWGPVEECADTDLSDRVFQCALPIKSGATGFVFQVKLPDARYWGDMSCDPTGGCGSTIGTVIITKGNMTLNYVMTPNPYGEPYYNGLLSNI